MNAIAAYRADPEAATKYYESEQSFVNDPPGLYLTLLKGNTIKLSPVFDAAEGSAISWRDDPLGNRYGAKLAAADEDGVEVGYLIPLPSQQYTFRKKTAWAIRANVPDIDNPGVTEDLIFFAGWLDLEEDVESAFTDQQKAVAAVIEARARIQAESLAQTVSHYRSTDSIDSTDSEIYVWLGGPGGNILADATMPELVGQNIADAYPDVGEDMLAVENFQSRWFTHMWTNPETNQVELKHSYVFNFLTIYIVSGYYGEEPPVVGPRSAAQAYVQEAIAAYREDPAAATEYYRSEASVDRDNDLYLFIVDGTEIILNGGFRGSEGEDITGRIGIDALGKEYGKEIAAAGENGTFVDYLIPDPLDNFTLYRKHTWAVKADGLVFAAGSWDRTEDVESSLEPHEHVVATIYKAGARLLAYGGDQAAFGRLVQYYNTPASIDGERYVFLVAPNGVIVADATMPALLRTNLADLQASDDPLLGQKIAAVQEGEVLWISHMWPNPATGQEEQKHTYVTKFRGIIFGSGYYGDTPPPGIPMPSDPCFVAIDGSGTHTGTWDDTCVSDRPAERGAGDRYARFYTFTLSRGGSVAVTLTSDDADTYLYLVKGEGKSGELVASNDDIEAGNTNSEISATQLEAGTYTIEATTYDAETGGDFTLEVDIELTDVPPPVDVKYIAISSGANHVCAIAENGSIMCWGDDSHGQVSERPMSGSFTEISSGDNHTCALREDGAVICWGSFNLP